MGRPWHARRVHRLAVAIMLLPLFAYADDVDVELRDKALAGREPPAVILHVNRAVSSIAIELTRDDGKAVRGRQGPLAKGKQHAFALAADVGTWRYQGQLSVVFNNGSSASMPLTFSVSVLPPLSITVPAERLFLKERYLEAALSGAADRCEHVVTFDGKPSRQDVARFSGESAGTWLRVAWRGYAEDDAVLRIQLTCHTIDGVFGGLELYPWNVEIPHEDVVFETGKWELLPTEAPKLDAALAALVAAVKRYSEAMRRDGGKEVTVYITGHTDTVGSSASNQALSLNRARAIAAYLRQRGLKTAMQYVGFGEERPAIATGDEVDEPQNRRAVYSVAVEPPLRAAWQTL